MSLFADDNRPDYINHEVISWLQQQDID